MILTVRSQFDQTEQTDIQKADHAYEFKNWKLAFNLYKRIQREAPNGHVYYRLGVMYKNGHFAKLNEKKSKDYFKLALDKLSPLAERGDCESLCDLGSMFEYGEGVDKNHTKAVEYYMQAADKGYAGAQCNLGYMYNNGRGVKLDREKAVDYYKRASKQNHVRAQYNLGYLYKYGHGVEKDYKLAVQYYRRSAEQGYTKAQHNLGFMYSNGYGVEKDKKKAAYYYKLAADQKNAMSSYNLALMYQRGEGVEQDHSMAFKYFLEATELGHKEAKSQLEKIQRHSGEGYNDYRFGAQIYAANQWPLSHRVLSQECKNAVMEVYFTMRCLEVPVELNEIMVVLLVKLWPKMGHIVVDHYVRNCEKLLKKKSC